MRLNHDRNVPLMIGFAKDMLDAGYVQPDITLTAMERIREMAVRDAALPSTVQLVEEFIGELLRLHADAEAVEIKALVA